MLQHREIRQKSRRIFLCYSFFACFYTTEIYRDTSSKTDETNRQTDKDRRRRFERVRYRVFFFFFVRYRVVIESDNDITSHAKMFQMITDEPVSK